MTTGGKDFASLDMKIPFAFTLIASPYKIILIYYHPCRKLEPSPQDNAITTKAVEAGKVIDIEFCDHIIVIEDGYYSLKDEVYF